MITRGITHIDYDFQHDPLRMLSSTHYSQSLFFTENSIRHI